MLLSGARPRHSPCSFAPASAPEGRVPAVVSTKPVSGGDSKRCRHSPSPGRRDARPWASAFRCKVLLGAFRTQRYREPVRRMGPRTTGGPSSRRPIPAWLKDPPSSSASAVRPRPLLKQFAVSLHAQLPILPSCLPAVVSIQSQRREPAPQRTLLLSRVPQRPEGECRPSFRPSRYRAATRNDAGIRPRPDAEMQGPGLARFAARYCSARFGRNAARNRSGTWGRGRRGPSSRRPIPAWLKDPVILVLRRQCSAVAQAVRGFAP